MARTLSDIDHALWRALAFVAVVALAGAVLVMAGEWVARQIVDAKALPAGLEFSGWLAAIGCLAAAGTIPAAPRERDAGLRSGTAFLVALGIALGLVLPAVALDWTAAESPFLPGIPLAWPVSVALAVLLAIVLRAGCGLVLSVPSMRRARADD